MADPSARQRLLKLSIRCESEEPSAELSADIAVAVGWRLKEPVSPPNWIHIKIAACGWPPGEKDWRYVPSYGCSLDAAVTLVPEGATWLRKSSEAMTIVMPRASEEEWARHVDGWGKTVALALCAASLRALAQEAGV
jgi:hypothetical protein